MDLGTLSVTLETNLKRFSEDMAKAYYLVDKTATDIQNRISGQFKWSIFSGDELNQIKKQFEMNANELPQINSEMNRRLYSATHSNLEGQLNDHKIYFDNLRSEWQFNESAITLMNKTEAAEREKILKDYANSSTNILRKLNSVFRFGFLTYAINSFADMGTAMMQAATKGEGLGGQIKAITSHLPIINRMTESFEKMGDALADLYLMGEISALPGFTKFNEQYRETFASMKLELDLLRSGGVETAQIIESEYQKQVKDINAMKEGTKELVQYQENLQKKIAALEKEKKSPIGQDMYGGATNKQIDKDIAAAKAKLETYSTVEQKENLILLAKKTRDQKLADLTKNQTETTIKSQNEITNATIRMYQDMQKYPQEYFDLQESLLQKQVDDYVKAGGDIVLAEQWKANEMIRINQETFAKLHPMAQKWKDLWQDIGQSVAGSMKSAYADIMMDAKNATDYLTNMLNSIQRAIHEAMFQQYISPIITNAVAGLGTMGGGSAGGGNTGGGYIPPWAPGKQYGGLIPKMAARPVFAELGRLVPRGTDTTPAMLSPGELVVPEKITSYLAKAFGNPTGGGSAPSQNVNINVSAIDAQGTYRFLNGNKRAIASMLNTTRSDNHPIRRK